MKTVAPYIPKSPETVEFPYRSGIQKRIPHPPMSTLCFPCDTCGAMIDSWCKNDCEDEPICDARKEMYHKAHDAYMRRVKARSICPFTTPHVELQHIVDEIIREVINA